MLFGRKKTQNKQTKTAAESETGHLIEYFVSDYVKKTTRRKTDYALNLAISLVNSL